MRPDTKNGWPAITSTKKVAVILAGGRSRRFGTEQEDKVWALFQGKPLIKILIDQLTAADCQVILSGPRDKLASLKLPVIEDQTIFGGPLLALENILAHIQTPKILLTACDMPFITSELVTTLWEQSLDYDLTLFSHQERPSPLPGIYDAKTLPAIRQLIQAGRQDLKALQEVIPKMNVLDCDPKSLWNVNTVNQLDWPSRQGEARR